MTIRRRDITYATLLTSLVNEAKKVRLLPSLPPIEKARLDTHRDIDHLYYSSKIEGTNLTDKQLQQAIYG